MRVINVDYTGFVQLDVDSINLYDNYNNYEKVDVSDMEIQEIIEGLNSGLYSVNLFEECWSEVLDGEDELKFSEQK